MARAVISARQYEQVITGSKVWRQAMCSCNGGRPLLPAMCVSPQRTIMTG
jgi:hypothetical protein